MSNVIKFPVIAGVEITTDDQGRFNLNALHRASGSIHTKRPSIWLATKQAQELVAELSQNSGLGCEPVESVKGGATPGTFAVEQLAVAYANWVSPKFYLIVIETFLTVRKKSALSLPNFSDPEEAAIAWVEQYRQTKQAKLERDEAIRTKSLIGSTREATAMATASAEKRRAEKLAEQIGDSEKWKQVKAIPWLSDVFEISRVMYQQLGKLLKKVSDELGIDVHEIENSEYGAVKAYHINAVNEVKRRLNMDAALLGKYRRNKNAA